jgi:hypothetical protein
MRDGLIFTAFFLLIMLASWNVNAFFNVTYLSTTVFLTNSTTAHVVEGVQVFVSNSSISVYNQDRQAVNLSISSWQKVIGSPLLVEHILNPKSSISNFTFLPGPITPAGNESGGYTSLTMSYDANNVTAAVSVAPRQFEYTLNSSSFNYLHTASGQSLPSSARLTITVPNGTEIASIYPVPDYPLPNSLGKYTGASFSWYSGEPLKGFNFVYIVKQTPQQEVVAYFNSVYDNYTAFIYILLILAVAGIAIYIYTKLFR